jgi:hypothetical protein
MINLTDEEFEAIARDAKRYLRKLERVNVALVDYHRWLGHEFPEVERVLENLFIEFNGRPIGGGEDVSSFRGVGNLREELRAMRDLKERQISERTGNQIAAIVRNGAAGVAACDGARHWPILYAILRPAITSGNEAVRHHAERLAEVLEGDQRAALRELLDRPVSMKSPVRVVHGAAGADLPDRGRQG